MAMLSALIRGIVVTGRLMDHPFQGFGVRFAAERSRQQSVRDFPLITWRRIFPAVTFVYLYVECFDGTHDRAGFAFHDSQVLQDIEFTESDLPCQLLRHPGAEVW